jgi:EmrB/QacA subfamily drug resistance transporter
MSIETQQRNYALLSATLSSFLIPFAGSALNLAIPTIGRELTLSSQTLNWVVTAYLLTSAIALLPLGRAADQFGRKAFFLWGIVIFSASSLVAGFARSGEMLIGARLMQGVGGAMIFGTAMPILTSIFPPQERGRVLGWNVGAVYSGLSLGPVVGGFLTEQTGWRSIFYLTFALGAVAALVTLKLGQEPRQEQRERYDLAGALLYSAGIAGMMAGLAGLRSYAAAPWLLGAGTLLLTGFVFHQLRVTKPLLDLWLFRDQVFLFSNLAALIHYCATFATGYLISLYLQVVKGASAQSAGMILLTQPVLMALLSPASGKLSDRIEPRLLASSGMGLTFTGLLLFGFLDHANSQALLIGNLVFLGVGFALFSSPNTNAVMGSVPRTHLGVAAATMGTMRLLGQALSMVLVSLFFALYLNNTPISPACAPQLLRGMRLSFWVFALLGAAGIVFSLARGSVRNGMNGPGGNGGRPARTGPGNVSTS